MPLLAQWERFTIGDLRGHERPLRALPTFKPALIPRHTRCQASTDQGAVDFVTAEELILNAGEPDSTVRGIQGIPTEGSFESNGSQGQVFTLPAKDIAQDSIKVWIDGVISFYGRQVRHIREAIRRLQAQRGKPFRAIHYNVNTVDCFQGREAPVVLVSLTRNKRQNRHSSNAFVAQFERINVALSRARELLVIFGAKRMFHSYPVTIPNLDRPGTMRRRVYQAILDDLLRRGCLWGASRVVSPEAYGRLLPRAAQATDRS